MKQIAGRPLSKWIRIRRRALRMTAIACATAWIIGCVDPVRAADEADEPQPTPIAELDRQEPVDFESEVLPLLKRSCLACHNATDAESELVLETPQTILKGGASGEVITAGSGAESYLLEVAAGLSEPVMPPPENDVEAPPLSSEELGLLKLWIDQGAKGSVSDRQQSITWQPLPPGVNPIYAVALSGDAQYVACGRAGQIFLYHVPTGQSLGRLTDPLLSQSAEYEGAGVAHRDLVQSLAFSPDGEYLASGGYRVVKLWQRSPRQPRQELALGAEQRPAMALSPDGQRLATATGPQVLLWELATGEQSGQLDGAEANVRALCFSPDGGQLIATTEAQKLHRWSLADAALSDSVELTAGIAALTTSPDGASLFAAGDDGQVYVFSTAELSAAPRAISGHGGPVRDVVIWPNDANRIATASADGTVRVWKVDSGEQLMQLDHGGPVNAVAVRPDGTRIASAGENNLARLWNADDGKQVAEVKGDVRMNYAAARLELAKVRVKTKLDAYQAQLDAAQKDSDAKAEAEKKSKEALAAAREAATKAKTEAEAAAAALVAAEKRVTDSETALKAAQDGLANAEQLAALRNLELKTLTATVEKLAGASQTQQKTAETAQANLATIIESIGDKTPSETLAGARKTAEQLAAKAAALSEELKAAHASATQTLAAVKASTEESTKMLAEAKATLEKAMTEAKQAPEAKVAAEKTAAEKLKAAQDAQGKIAPAERAAAQAEQIAARAVTVVNNLTAIRDGIGQAVEQVEQSLSEIRELVTQFEQPLAAVAFSPDSELLAVAGSSGRVSMYTAENATPLESHIGHAGAVAAVAFTGENAFVSAAEDGQALEWPTYAEWKLVRRIGPADPESLDVSNSAIVDRALALDFNPQGELLAVGGGQPSRSGELKLFNVADGTLVREFPEAHSDTVFSVEFSPQGQRLASSAADKFVKVFEVDSGETVRAFEGHTHHVLGVCWRDDGKTLASAGADAVVKLWNMQTGEQIRTIGGFGKQVTAIEFIASGAELVASSGDTNVRMYNADNGKAVRTFTGAADYLYALSVSEDGQRVAAGGEDSVLRVWNAADAKLIIGFDPPTSPTNQQASR